jgi:hypothetical protein
MIHFQGGFPPGPHAGDISPVTRALRPRVALSDEQCAQVRRNRRSGKAIGEIAADFGCSIEDVRVALATMRTRNRARSRATLNVTLAAWEFVASEANGGEVLWATVDRLLGELTIRRAFAGEQVRSR